MKKARPNWLRFLFVDRKRCMGPRLRGDDNQAALLAAGMASTA
jgi:hypothetical protein